MAVAPPPVCDGAAAVHCVAGGWLRLSFERLGDCVSNCQTGDLCWAKLTQASSSWVYIHSAAVPPLWLVTVSQTKSLLVPETHCFPLNPILPPTCSTNYVFFWTNAAKPFAARISAKTQSTRIWLGCNPAFSWNPSDTTLPL